ncbi:hypothetical protein OE88DRAFT_1664746 [Heliocybe sulcata]|uniref:F-box domain-containing protein n=1 Tax=Heliocybe sulcata TaxID=5364 RepID=A0A5C3MTX3_9AGAM|nr:hypothetical protein OE88DRAFT_1664746 [Heliocybe sulcata]
MASRLESLPHPILEECGWHVALSSKWGSLGNLPSLLLSSRRLHAALSYPSSTSLYARLFGAIFPVNHFFAPSPSMTDATVAKELVERFRTIRRVRMCLLDEGFVPVDLWRLYLMLLESDGALVEPFHKIGLPIYLTSFYQTCLYRFANKNQGWPRTDDVAALAMWVSWYTMTEESIHAESMETREEVLTRIRPFAMNCLQMSTSLRALSSLSEAGSRDISGLSAQALCNVTHFSQRLILSCPNLSSAAILLTFARKDALVLRTPQHLNPAVPHQGAGPTYQDCRQFQMQSKPKSSPPIALRRQTLPPHGVSGPAVCSDDIRRLFFVHRFQDTLEGRSLYTPGRMSGSWSGKLFVSPLIRCCSGITAAQLPDFLCQRPLQCNLREYIRHDANPGRPQHQDVWRASDDDAVSWCQDMQRFDIVRQTNSIELHERVSGRILRYELMPTPHVGSIYGSGSSQTEDVVIAGETDSEHDRAWGAFLFFGTVRLQDGRVILRRYPVRKRNDDPSQPEFGAWVFEGYVHAGSTFVGRWRPDPTLHSSGGCEGIFRLNKRVQDRPFIEAGIRASL